MSKEGIAFSCLLVGLCHCRSAHPHGLEGSGLRHMMNVIGIRAFQLPFDCFMHWLPPQAGIIFVLSGYTFKSPSVLCKGLRM